MATRSIWVFLGGATSAVAGLVLTYETTIGDVLYLVTYLTLCTFMWLAVRRTPPGRDRRPWVLVAASQSLWVIGDSIEMAYFYLTGDVPPVGVADVFWLAGYPLLALALTMMARRRAPGRLRGAVLDGLTLTVAGAMASWQFLIAPYLDSGYGLAEMIVPPLYPVADVALLAAVLFIALSPGDRRMPTRLLLAAVGLYLTIDIAYNVLPNFLDYTLVARIGPLIMLGNAMIIAACLHPDRAELTRPGQQVNVLHPSRVLFLGLAFLSAPVLSLVENGLARNAVIALVATALSTGFILARFTIAVREQEKAQAQLAYQARHDPLTGLANRAVLTDELERVMPRRSGPVAVLYLDLDGFKQVNDTHGHEAGDLVLATVARRLSSAVRGTDLVVRLGGDEFVLLCPDLPEADAIRLAERVVGDVAQPISFRGALLDVGASVGIAAYGADAPAHDSDVLRTADMAMYQAKKQGRGRWVMAGA
ncbi:GGDEF domain-containing protein [Actinoplanes sp. NEAU-A12]|uniref:GGDEF domain-containing protein n=1 Tax=Actinoplanes sandaracinus TaxID=3045177 RepID=A0ABT6WI04_9ACTN|nr:GGDEF domain-containing protein [Actinoplanes sandaracinus]MDI6099333.1 GGDEF domain-containing protein [Actinoplanes sandaracinus]